MATITPKQLGRPNEKESRLALLDEKHMLPLTNFVNAIREEKGESFSIPYFDPKDGGVNARILLLMEAPGPGAIKSGFVSCDNPDETAKNLFELLQKADISRSQIILWNIVPWYIGNDLKTKTRTARIGDINKSFKYLEGLVNLLSNLDAVILLGKHAQRASSLFGQEDESEEKDNLGKGSDSRPIAFECPHPSPQSVNPNPGNREIILQALVKAKQHIDKT